MTVLSPRQVRLMTVEDWVQHPEADQYELVDGVLRARSAGENLHEITTPRLASLLGQHLDAHGVEGAAFGSRAKYRVRSRRGISTASRDELTRQREDAVRLLRSAGWRVVVAGATTRLEDVWVSLGTPTGGLGVPA